MVWVCRDPGRWGTVKAPWTIESPMGRKNMDRETQVLQESCNWGTRAWPRKRLPPFSHGDLGQSRLRPICASLEGKA